MSRIGKKEITLPTGVEVKLVGDEVEVKGPKGTLKSPMVTGISMSQDGDTLTFARADESKQLRASHGLVRTLVNNNITGVTSGFEKNLILNGVGYRAQKKGKQLVLSLGFSHDVIMDEPSGITIEIPEPTKIKIMGIDKQRVGQIAAKIREYRKPEPYKGKGIRYSDEVIRRKAGKAGKK